jgi:signal transduction histidine kinase
MFATERRATLRFGLAVLATLFVGVGDRATGADLVFTLMYLLPIGAAAWCIGPRAAIVIAALSSLLSVANTASDGRLPLPITLWNELGVLLIFVGCAYLVGRQRQLVEIERRQKDAIVDQLRHSDRLNVIGTLAAGIAHEIGTPLNVITGSAELIDGARPEELRVIGTTIHEQADRIGAIIRHLLDFGRRAGSGRVDVNLNDLARSTSVLLAPTARKRGLAVDVETAARPVIVRGNAAELEQVLSNLLLNAVQAMASRGGHIVLRVGTATHANGRQPRGFGTLQVEDTGVGIAPENLPKIFDPFFTTKEVGEGTGLGLSVSYGIVHDHGGSIAVESAPGRGTRFTVELPLADTRPSHAPGTTAAA